MVAATIVILRVAAIFMIETVEGSEEEF